MTFTFCGLFLRMLRIQWHTSGSVLMFKSVVKSLRGLMEVKAELKSMNRMYVWVGVG